MNKLFILFFIFLPFVFPSYAQTNIYLIGTMHRETSYINADSLYNIFLDIKPDVILVELDSAFFTTDFKLNQERYPDILSTNENMAIHRYRTEFGVNLRPYEIEGRNVFYQENNFFENEQKMFSEIVSLYTSGKLDARNRDDYELIIMCLSIQDEIQYASLREFNSDAATRWTMLKQRIFYDKMISIARTTPELNHWIVFAQLRKDFWAKRNKAMTANILQFANEFQGKSIIVLTGMEHKHYLKRFLSEKNIVVKEYWE